MRNRRAEAIRENVSKFNAKAAREGTKTAGQLGGETSHLRMLDHIERVKPYILQAIGVGITSNNGIANYLNTMGITGLNGGGFFSSTIKRYREVIENELPKQSHSSDNTDNKTHRHYD